MKIKKFESKDYSTGDYDYEYGGHVFVFARYKNGWDNFLGNQGRNSFKNEEFVPCMISGVLFSKFDKQNLWVVGHTGSYNINDFEIIKGSDKDIKELIDLHVAKSKYNL